MNFALLVLYGVSWRWIGPCPYILRPVAVLIWLVWLYMDLLYLGALTVK